MTNTQRLEKNATIKQTLAKTRLKRKNQKPVCVSLKINTRKLNRESAQTLKMMFVQCKWLYNYLIGLSAEEFKTFDTKSRDIWSLDKSGSRVEHRLDIPAKLIQSVYTNIKNNQKGLEQTGKHGRRTGKLKFVSTYSSIELNQYGITHIIANDRLKINGIKQKMYVFGLEQINPSWEFANARLIQKPSGYYLLLTCYKPKEESKPKDSIGIDMGIKTSVTTSDGQCFDVEIGEHERLKGLQRKLARQQKGSNGFYKTKHMIQREYERLANKRTDLANQILHILRQYNVYMQDENLKAWHRTKFASRTLQNSCLGTLKRKLISNGACVIDRRYPSTKLCPVCGKLNTLELSDRIYRCECGFEMNRDIKAAICILLKGEYETLPRTEHTSTPEEGMSDFISYCKAAMKQFPLRPEAVVPLGRR